MEGVTLPQTDAEGESELDRVVVMVAVVLSDAVVDEVREAVVQGEGDLDDASELEAMPEVVKVEQEEGDAEGAALGEDDTDTVRVGVTYARFHTVPLVSEKSSPLSAASAGEE